MSYIFAIALFLLGIDVGRRMYRSSILRIANAGTTERLADGKHYYIISEHDYLKMKSMATRSVLGDIFRKQKDMRMNLPEMKG